MEKDLCQLLARNYGGLVRRNPHMRGRIDAMRQNMKKIQLVGVLAVAVMVLAGLPAWATVSDCVGVTFTFDDTTPSTGASSNNVRYLTVSGISVRVTGFSRATNGTWVTANVGA